MKIDKLIYFEWFDSTQDNPGWNTREEAITLNIHGCQAGGLFLHEDDDAYFISPFSNPADGEVLGTVAVPKVNVVKESILIIHLLDRKDER